MSCFRSLCTTLEATFSATPLNEDELDYGSATLILAGLLQLHTRVPRYASFQARLDSFPQHEHREEVSPVQLLTTSIIPGSLQRNTEQQQQQLEEEDEEDGFVESTNHSDSLYLPSPNELASAGFFHTGSSDETVCPACGLGLRDWQATDLPEACHLAFSAIQLAASNGTMIDSNGLSQQNQLNTLLSLPCLYSAVRRLLVSELPLARKSLLPAGPVRSISHLPGVIQRSRAQFASLSDRLHAIARLMSAPSTLPEGWPVKNARTLGHSNDLIVIALWRLQAEVTGATLAYATPCSALRLDPHATTDLLRAVLRVQEGFVSTSNDDFLDCIEDEVVGEVISSQDTTGEADLSTESGEPTTVSPCQFHRIPSDSIHLSAQFKTEDCESSFSPQYLNATSSDGRRFELPRFYDFLRWWVKRWPPNSI